MPRKLDKRFKEYKILKSLPPLNKFNRTPLFDEIPYLGGDIPPTYGIGEEWNGLKIFGRTRHKRGYRRAKADQYWEYFVTGENKRTISFKIYDADKIEPHNPTKLKKTFEFSAPVILNYIHRVKRLVELSPSTSLELKTLKNELDRRTKRIENKVDMKKWKYAEIREMEGYIEKEPEEMEESDEEQEIRYQSGNHN